jgi:hypothetical protein
VAAIERSPCLARSRPGRLVSLNEIGVGLAATMRLDATLVRIVLVPMAMKPLATGLVAAERAEPLAIAPAAGAGPTFASGTGPPTELHLTAATDD